MKRKFIPEYIPATALVHLYEETSELEKRCIYDVMQKNKDGSAKERLSRAYAICRATLQKSGRMKKGTEQMTRKGAGISGGKSKKKDHGEKVAGFEKAVKAARVK